MSKLGGQHVTALCLLWALACSDAWQPSDGGVVPHRPRSTPGALPFDTRPVNGHQPVEPTHVITVSEALELGWVHGCGAGFTAEAASVDPIGAVTEASPFHCTGGRDGFDCECNGERKTSRAYSCAAALFEACGAAAEAIDGSGVVAPAPERCASFGPETGNCAKIENGYECRCVRTQSPWPMRTFVPMPAPSPASCDQAVFSVCAQSCANGFGICEPSPGGTIGAYGCTCRTNNLPRVFAANGCEEALSQCDPLNTTENQCSGFGGFCEATDGRAHCRCIDGSQHDIPLKPDASVRCQELLESTCGLGAPTEGGLCIKEANGYRARCTRSPDVLGGLRCECHRQDDEPGEGRVFDVPETSCNEATLMQVCVEVAPVDDEGTAQACQHYIDCEAVPGLIPERCTEDIGETCVACTLGELSRLLPGPLSCPSSPVNCAESCGSVLFFSPPE